VNRVERDRPHVIAERAVTALRDAIVDAGDDACGECSEAVAAIADHVIAEIDAREQPPPSLHERAVRTALVRDALAFVEYSRGKQLSTPENLSVLAFIDRAILAYADPERKR